MSKSLINLNKNVNIENSFNIEASFIENYNHYPMVSDCSQQPTEIIRIS